jgi:DinB superfamily
MSESLTLIAEQLSRAAKTFLKAMDEFPEQSFFTNLPAGGHSTAWHALHIADWTRILVPAKLESTDSSLRFAYLGWEDAEFSARVKGSSPANLDDGKPAILEYLKSELERSVKDVQSANGVQLEAKIVVPMGERVVRVLLLTQIGHVPYHYGQVKLNAKQLL